MTPLQKLTKNVGDLCKLIAAKGFKKLPKVQKIAQSSHTALWFKVAKLLILLTLEMESRQWEWESITFFMTNDAATKSTEVFNR